MTTEQSYLAEAAGLLRLACHQIATRGGLQASEWNDQRFVFLERFAASRASGSENQEVIDTVLRLLMNAKLDLEQDLDLFMTPASWEQRRDAVYLDLATIPADGGRRLSRVRTVLGEVIRNHPEPDGVIYHLPDRTRDFERTPDFAPVLCGGGLILPPRSDARPENEICPDCLTGKKTL